MPVTIIGVDKLTDEFNKLSRAAELSQDRFINTISKQKCTDAAFSGRYIKGRLQGCYC